MIADLLGIDESEARTALGDMVFTDPVTDELVHTPAYLSGDIYRKLDAASARAESDPAFLVNVEALHEILPKPLNASEVTAKVGAVWISDTYHQQFLRELLHANEVRVESPMPGMWDVKGGRLGIRATSGWGTKRTPAPELLKALAEQRPVPMRRVGVRDVYGESGPAVDLLHKYGLDADGIEAAVRSVL